MTLIEAIDSLIALRREGMETEALPTQSWSRGYIAGLEAAKDLAESGFEL